MLPCRRWRQPIWSRWGWGLHCFTVGQRHGRRTRRRRFGLPGRWFTVLVLPAVIVVIVMVALVLGICRFAVIGVSKRPVIQRFPGVPATPAAQQIGQRK